MGKGVKRALVVLCAAFLALAAALALYPSAAKLYGGWRASRQQSAMEAVYSQAPAADVEAALEAASDANAALAAGASAEAGADSLDLDGSGIISWLEVPKLGLVVPVYREATESNLMAGAARVEGSSLPVGGESACAVVVGHSGMVTSQMFDRIGELEPGDEIVFRTLGRPFAYRVTGSEVVEPAEAEKFAIGEGSDLAELVTCRPIGVNSHRLVVRAERCDDEAAVDADGASGGERGESPPLWSAPVGIALAAPVLLWFLAWLRRPWRLVRVTGARPLAEAEVARLGCRAGPMRLDLKCGGRARLRLFGAEARGAWSRSRDDLGRVYRLELGGPAFGPYKLPEGAFCAREEGGVLKIWSEGGASALHFERRRPHRRGAAGGDAS